MLHLPSERCKRRAQLGANKAMFRLSRWLPGGHDTISSALYGIHGFSRDQLRAGESCQLRVYHLYMFCTICANLTVLTCIYSCSQSMPEHIIDILLYYRYIIDLLGFIGT